MATTGSFLDLIQPRELINFARALPFYEVNFLDQFLPSTTVDQLEFSYTVSQLLEQDSAVYRALDTEAPLGKRQGFSRKRQELPPMSKAMRLGEEEQLRLRALETGNYDPIIQRIFDDVANEVRSIQIRLELARGEVLSAGTVTINENGLNTTIDYGIASGHKTTAGTAWSDPTADILGDLRTIMTQYLLDTRGQAPTQMLVSRKLLNYMLANTAIRNLYSGVTFVPSQITQEQLQGVLTAHGFPTIIVDQTDRSFPVAGSNTRVLPENKLIIMPPNGYLGSTVFGVPAEAIAAAEAGVITTQEAPGIYAQTWRDNNPESTWSLATAMAIPVMPNPHLIWIHTAY